MKGPCEICMDKDRCGGSQPCQKKTAYGRYKKKCKEIAKHTKKGKMMDDFMKGAKG